MTVSTSSLVVGLFSILGLQQVQVVGVADSLHDREYLHSTLKLSTNFRLFSQYEENRRCILLAESDYYYFHTFKNLLTQLTVASRHLTFSKYCENYREISF